MQIHKNRHIRALTLITVFLLLAIVPIASANGQVRNVIIMIGDGMGLSHITAARISQGSPDEVLNMDTMPITGFARNSSLSSLVTDSAAAGTALATGVRTENGRIATTPDNQELKSLMLLARDRGMGTGAAVTSKLIDATPAAYLVQVSSRSSEREIAEKVIESNVNVLLGGGLEVFGANPFTRQPRKNSLIQQAIDKGYTFISDKEDLLALEPEEGQNILGLFSLGDMSYDIEKFPNEPSLAEMTTKAIELLDTYEEGFFLMVEGSKIDKGSHHNLTEEVIGDTAAFDEAVGAALAYARERDDTLVIVTADHETGGFAITGGTPDGSRVNHEWLLTDHTGVMVPVYAYGPGSERFSGTQHLTDIAHKIAELLEFSPFPQYLTGDVEAVQATVQAPEHVVFVIIDGFDPYYFEYGLPNLEALGTEGVWVRNAKTIMPAATTAAMTSLITGNYPKTHGVPNNVYYDRELNIRRESPREYTVPNIGELFQEAGYSTMSVNHFMMYKGADEDITGGWNTVNTRFKKDRPTLLVFIEQTPDAVGHQRGSKSTEMAAAMKRADRSFGKLINTLKKEDVYDNTLIIVTGDHGMTHIDEGKRLGSAVANALQVPGLKTAYLEKGVSPSDDTDLLWYHMVTGAAVIYKNPITAEQEEMLINQLLAIPGVDSVWTQEKIAEEGMHPDTADLWINLKDGYGLAAKEMGGHSSIYQQSVPILIKGPGVKGNLVIEGESGIRTIDIVPTILHLMGIEIPETIEGRVLREILE